MVLETVLLGHQVQRLAHRSHGEALVGLRRHPLRVEPVAEHPDLGRLAGPVQTHYGHQASGVDSGIRRFLLSAHFYRLETVSYR
ncbi:hypothetical protein GCM10010253_59620 [Streptomyces badius]|uniref:Uncharacterized protein n=1 Tax=Streptomyces badius TaxID=1941 RepID=A0ABQ2TMG9_STRBA|nr:hypothetical protein GCM10010253_59620 [Streptomyces badius]